MTVRHGPGQARDLLFRIPQLDGSVTAIRAGLTQVDHFEELTLFGPGVGVDRISDITCNVLKRLFIDYTKSVTERHGVEMQEIGVRHASWSAEFRRWNDAVVALPRNPSIKRGLLLTPDRFLREIPVIEPSDFWDWSWSNHNEDLRNDFNYEIGVASTRGKSFAWHGAISGWYANTYARRRWKGLNRTTSRGTRL